MRRGRTILTMALVLCAVAGFAQPGGGGDPGGGQPVPFSGIEVLLVGGAALGIHAMRKLRKRNTE